MKQFKAIILGIFILFSTGLYANSVNMAPIISYLLSDTTSSSLSASDFTMALDVNESIVTEDWKVSSAVSDTESTASVKTQGTYGLFEVDGDSLSYQKSIETNTTDSGILEITNGIETIEITVTVTSLNWEQISAGALYTVALRSDGTIWAWGQNDNGQLGDGTTTHRSVPTQEITGATNWISVSGGDYHTVALKSDGTLWSWGRNFNGEIGDGTTTDRSVPTQEITGATDWSLMTAGGYNTLAIKENGTLWLWGYNLYGQVGDGTTTNRSVPTQEATLATDWISVGGGGYYSVAMKENRTIWSWGDNRYGQLGDGTTTNRSVPTQEITGATDWSFMIAGEWVTLTIKDDGTLWSWGYNEHGGVGDGTITNRSVPTQEITGATDWKIVDGGSAHTVAIKDNGTLWTWGYNINGQLGDGTTTNRLVPTQEITEATDWYSVDGGWRHTVGLKHNRTLWTWGYNAYGQLGDGTNNNTLIPSQPQASELAGLTASNFMMVLDNNETIVIEDWKVLSNVSDTEATATILTQGNYGVFEVNGDSISYVKGSGSNTADTGMLEITNGSSTVQVKVIIDSVYWRQISGGSSFTIAIKSDGTLWAWGANGGKLGDGTIYNSLVPVQEFTKGNDWSSVSAGWNHTAAIKSDGTLWSWGGNNDGQLGDGTEETRIVPTQEATKATNWSSVSAGYYFTVALKSDGSLWAWGDNYYGQLGDGTEEIDRNVSTQEVTGATDWIAVSAGSTHTVALKSDGSLWAWGANASGQLCDGTKTYKMVPTKEVTGATDWVSVNAGTLLTTALKSDGTIWSCGYGNYGQIGDGTTTLSVTVPTQEDTNATDWSSVSAGYYHVHAIKSDGTLWSWGKNDRGQLADGTEDHKSVPTQESTGDIDWVSVSAGSSNAHATKSDGTLWGWGANGSGALGDGTEVDRNVSTPILPRDYD